MTQNGVLGGAATKAVFDSLDRGDKLEGALRAGLLKLISNMAQAHASWKTLDLDEHGLVYLDIEAGLVDGWPKAVHKIGHGREFKSPEALLGFARLHMALAEGVATYCTATGVSLEREVSSFSNVLRLALWDATESTYVK